MSEETGGIILTVLMAIPVIAFGFYAIFNLIPIP